jgi:hypothetical protein
MAEEEDENSARKALRNKMVSFMYLIFIVLAFIYIPSDFIDTIRDINSSLSQSSQKIEEAKSLSQIILSAGQKKDSAHFNALQAELVEITIKADSIVFFIEGLKIRLYEKAGGTTQHGFLKYAKDNQYTDEIFFTEEKGLVIKNLLKDYKQTVSSGNVGISPVYLDSILPTPDSLNNSVGKLLPWEKFYFYKMPLSVTLTLLNKFQNDIRRIELLAYNSLYQTIDEKYNITLSEKNQPKIVKEEPKDIKSFNGEAYIKNTDQFSIFTDINNVLKIYHPKVKSSEMKVEISNGEIYLKDSLFYCRVPKSGAVEIKAFSADGQILLISQKFVARRLPDPTPYFADRKGGSISSKIFKIQKNIEVKSEINENEVFTVKSFSMTKINTRTNEFIKSESNPGAFFNAGTRNMIDNCQRGDVFIFDNIEIESPGGTVKIISPMVFTVI